MDVVVPGGEAVRVELGDLAFGPAAGQTVTTRTRPAAAGLRGAGQPARPGAPLSAAEPGGDGAGGSARVAAAQSRARERIRRQRLQMRPLAWAFIAAVVISASQGRPAPGLAGTRLGITVALAVCVLAAMAGPNPRWAERRNAAQALVIGLLAGGGVALAALQPHGATGLAASLAMWIAAGPRPGRPLCLPGGAGKPLGLSPPRPPGAPARYGCHPTVGLGLHNGYVYVGELTGQVFRSGSDVRQAAVMPWPSGRRPEGHGILCSLVRPCVPWIMEPP